jgi:hypothetical protein
MLAEVPGELESGGRLVRPRAAVRSSATCLTRRGA